VLGALLLTTLPEALRAYGDWEVPLYGLVLILVTMFLPGGLAGLLAALGRRASAPLGRRASAADLVMAPPGHGETTADVVAVAPKEPAGRGAHGRLVAAGPADTRPVPAGGRPRGGPAGPPGAVPLLDVRGLGKNFGGLRAVSGCSFAVQPGEIKAVIGPNGAGKTTLFNVITGVYAPSAGEVVLGGRAVTGLPPHRIARLGVSRTFQNLQVFPSLSVAENVMIGRHRHGRAGFAASALALPVTREDGRRQAGAALDALDRVGLAGAAAAPAGSLPFGRQKLVELARALASEPALLLLDEPAAGLNTGEKGDMMALIGRLRAGGITIVIIEHDMRLVMGVSDRIVVLNHGQKIAEGSPAEVRRHPEVVKVYLGEEVESPAGG